METAEHREPCESRGSRTDLGAPGGEIPPGDSTYLYGPAARCKPKMMIWEVGLAHLYGPAARCKPKMMIWKVGLAHLYPAYSWSL